MTETNSKFRGIRCIALVCALCVFSSRTFAAEAAAAPRVEDVIALADQLFTQIQNEEPENIWDAVNRLVRLGRANGNVVTERLEKQLASSDPKVRLACARALCQLNLIDEGAPVLVKLVQNAPSAELRKLAANAIGLSTALAGDQPTCAALLAALKTESDSFTRISIARTLWYIGPHADGREALLKLLAEAPDKNTKDEIALVLAENGALQVPEVRLRTLNLFNEPTAQGERARNILRNADDENGRARDTKTAQGEQLLREVLRAIKTAYPDESKAVVDKLFEDAAKGMVGGLDPFSQYMDRDEVKATHEMLQQDYGGIGAYVGLRNSNFVITSPIYGSPADRAGLRALDIIQEVDRQKTTDLIDKGGVNGVIARLKGKPGTSVTLKYFRRGFSKAVEVSIVRENIRVETVFSAMLPGQVGFIRLTRFSEHSSDELQKALDNLLKQQKARAIILDLRDNPGGLLRSGVEISDKFLEGNKLIVYSEGSKEFAPRKDYFSSGGPEDEAYPLVVLVGAGSASASEIVAGAMQDHKRATLIGEKTFGKGSVQQIMPLRSTDRQTQLRLTIAKYYLPSGRCIHERGVDVDVEVKQPESHSWIVEGLMDLRKRNVFDEHVFKTWDAHKDEYMTLAIHDENKWENWPGFEDFYTGLKTRLERDDIRAEIRACVRRRVQDEQKKELVYDLAADEVLQRGVLEALNKLKVDPQTIADYKSLPEKFKKKTEMLQEGAMLPEKKGNP